MADIHVTTQVLDYPDLSPHDLASERLTDLNNATREQLKGLGLDPESLERLIDNRPYRSRLELISRMVLSEVLYESIKGKIAIAEGREPVKVAIEG